MLKLAVLASNRGSNLQAIIDACKSGFIDAEVSVVISNNKASKALERARKENINNFYIIGNSDHFLSEVLKSYDIDFVILAGYIEKIGPLVLKEFPQKIINVHPSLLPKYGGVNMYGLNVHKAVIDSGDNTTGVTIHYVNEEYDKGQIIDQLEIKVKPTDTPESLAKRVLKYEHKFLIEVIKNL